MRVPLEPPPGLVSDDTTFAAEGRWEDGNNVRFWREKPQTIGGWGKLFTETLNGVCRNLRPWTNVDGDLRIVFGTHSHLQLYYGGELFDITPSGLTTGSVDSPGNRPGYGAGAWDEGTYSSPSLVYYPRTWSLYNFGANILASPRGGTLYQWEGDPDAAATEVTNAPDQITSMLVVPERQVLAFGCNEEVSGDFNPLCIRFCDVEDVTDWTTLPTNLAGEVVLDGGGHFVGARLIGGYVAAWTDRSLYLGQFTGNPDQPWRFDLVAEHCGLIAPNAVEIVDQTAWWLGPDYQFRTWQLGNVPQVIPCPIRNDFKDNLDTVQEAKICALTVSQYGEVWWFYPDSRDGNENSRYVALSIIDGSWFRGQLPRTAAVDAGATSYPVAVTEGGTAYYHEYGADADGSALDWHIKSADQYIGNGERVMQVQGVWPDFEDQQGAINLTVYVRQHPQAEAVTKGPYELAASGAKKDFRASGRIASLKFSGSSAPAMARLGKPAFEVIPLGFR